MLFKDTQTFNDLKENAKQILKQWLFCWVVIVTSQTDGKLNLYSSSSGSFFFGGVKWEFDAVNCYVKLN